MRSLYLFQVFGLALITLTVNAQVPDSAALDAAIHQNRQGVLVIKAPSGAKVTVDQQRHEFWFGAALSSQAFTGQMRPDDQKKYREIFLTNFNSAVTENALKWHSMESRRGEIDYKTVDAILAWTHANQIPLRGHNIYWGIPERVQNWLKELPDDQFRAALKARALDVGARYKGQFAEYDLNNEMIHGNYYEDRLGKDITLQMAQWVRQADSNAVLFLNDYDILTGVRLDDYIKHIQTLLNQGVPIGGIGVQGHLHAESFDPKVLQNALDKLSQFHLPIRVTEFNLPGQRSKYYNNPSLRMTEAEEEAKAQDLANYYRICFACPQVEGILMWGFWEGANWIPVSSLYRRDWTPLPAAAAYRDLVYHQWWTHWEGQADAQGNCQVPAFYGQHRIQVGDKTQVVLLKKAQKQLSVTFN